MAIPALAYPTVSFGSLSLQSSDIITESVLDSVDSLPDRTINIVPVARSNRSMVISNSYSSRSIALKCHIQAATMADAHDILDNLKSQADYNTIERNLDIEYAGGTRRFKASIRSLNAKKVVGSENDEVWYDVDILFVCASPFGISPTLTTVSEAGVTTSPKSIATPIYGTTGPLNSTITIDVNSCTSLSEIEIQNTLNADTLTITRTFSAADQVIISFETKKVLVNGAEFDYTGIIPLFEPGTNTWTVTSTSTAHNLDITLTYNKHYL